MAQIYEGMFLLDNEVVRESWSSAKALVTDVLTKNGATVHTARRWDERKLAYPVKRRERASYVLVHYEIPREGIPPLIRDLDLSERILRYLLTRAAGIPEGEAELARAEEAADFQVPEPPPDSAGTWAAVQGPVDESADEDDSDDDSEDGDVDEDTDSDEGDELSADDSEERPARKKPETVAAAAGSDETQGEKQEES